MNLFSQEEPVNLFGGLSEDPALDTPQVDPQTSARKGRLAALALEPPEGIIGQLEERTKLYAERIQAEGDRTVREQAAANQQLEELRGLARLSPIAGASPEDALAAQDSAALASQIIAEGIDKRQKYALEQEAIKKIQDVAAAGDVVQAKLLLNNLELGDADQRIRDSQTKQMILARHIENAQIAKDQQGWFSHVTDFLLQAIPLNSSISNNNLVDVEDGMKGWLDWLFSGKIIRTQSDSLYNMSVEDFSDYVEQKLIPAVKENSTLWGFENRTEELDLLSHIARAPSEFETNAYNALDNLGFVPVTKLGKVGNLGKMAVNLGARKQYAEAVARAAESIAKDGGETALKKTGISAEEVADNIRPTIVNTGEPVSNVPVGTDVISLIEQGKAVLAELLPQGLTERLASGELDKAVKVVAERAERVYGDIIKDVSAPIVQTLPDRSNVKFLDITLGKNATGGYKTEKQANGFLSAIGVEGTVIRDQSGQWFAKIRVPIPESGFYTNLLNVKATNSVARSVLSSRLLEDKIMSDWAIQSGNTRNQTQKVLTDYYVGKVDQLGSSEKLQLADVIAKGTNESKWYTRDQFDVLYERAFKRLPAEKEWEAYTAIREVQDLAYILRNSDIYKTKFNKGFRTVSFDIPGSKRVDRVNALVDEELNDLPRTRVYVVDEGVHFTHTDKAPIGNQGAGRRMTASDLAGYKSQGYTLFSLEKPHKLKDGTEIKTFLVKQSNVENLRIDQLGYKEGSNRFYKGDYYVKQTHWGMQPDTGSKFLKNPRVFINGSRAELVQWTKTMNAARLAAKGGADETALDDIFNANPGYPTGKEFLDGVKDGTYDLDEEFGVFFDREMPDAYIRNPDMLDYVDLEEGGFNGLMRQTGRSYTSARGEQLKDFKGALAPTLDPFETVDRALTNVANLSSFSDYKMVALERWSTTFKPYLNYKDGASDYEVFSNGIIKPGTDSKIVNAMLAQKAAVERNLGWKSAGARRWEQETRKFAEWVIGDDPTKIKTKVLTKVGDWVKETDPLNALRGFAFDMKLGFFNPVQWPLQIQTSIAALTLDPANGMKGMFTYPFVRTYIRKAGGEQDLDFMVKGGHHKLMGFEDPKEFKEFMRDIKKSGWLVVNNTHALINDYGVNVATDTANNLFSTVREKGRFFFHEAEIMNRTVARRIAWDRVKKMGITDPAEFDRTLAGVSEDYAFNMTRESGAAWQQGLLSIPTQFWSYNARMLEAMFSNKFTPAQRARLVIGQGILYGSAGVPGASMIMNWQNTQDGHVSEANTVAGLIERGLYDWALTNAFGTDLSVGQRMGTGDFIPGLFADIFGMSQYGEKSPIEMVVGATGSIGAQTGTPLIDIIHQIGMYSQGESGAELAGTMTEKSFKELMLNISSLSNASKAYFVYKYGTYMSNSGNTQATDMPPMSAAAVLVFGAKPGEALQTEALFAYKTKRDESVKDAVKIISQYRTRFVNEPENREEITKQINLYTKMLPPDIRKAAIQKVQRDPDKSIYESLHRQVEKLKMEKERMATVGNSN